MDHVAVGATKTQVNGSTARDGNRKYGESHGSIPWWSSFAFIALSLSCGWAQVPNITIAAGSPTDQYFSGGIGAWAVPLPAPLSFLRYSQPTDPKCPSCIRYDIPLPRGVYAIDITLVEPNKTAAGQRIMNITANGQTTANIDVFAATGGINVPYNVPLMALVGAGFLHLQFNAVVGNAIVSKIAVAPYPPVIVTSWETCSGAPIGSDCSGIERITIQKADGSTVVRLAEDVTITAQNVIWKPVTP